MPNDTIIDTLKAVLPIRKELVALKTWKQEPQNIPKYQGNAFPGMCTQIGEVLATGAHFYTGQEQCFCTGGVVATGVAPSVSKDQREEMLEAHFAMSKSYKDMNTAVHYEDVLEEMKPVVEEKNVAVQVGLFKDIEDPDVILIFCTPGTADILNRTYCYITGEPVQGFGGNGACPFAIQYPYVTKRPSFTYSDVAWRKYVGLTDEELTVSYPYHAFVQLMGELPAVAEAYRKYGEVPEE